MKQGQKFYASYQHPEPLSRARVTRFRKQLLSFIEPQPDLASLSPADSIQFQIITPLFSSHEHRKIVHMHHYSSNSSASSNKRPFALPAHRQHPQPREHHGSQAQSKKNSGPFQLKRQVLPEELPRLTVSQKKLQHTARREGLAVAPQAPASSGLFLSLSLLFDTSVRSATRAQSAQAKRLLTFRGARAQRKAVMQDALRFMNDIAIKLRMWLRGAQTLSPVCLLPESPITRKEPSPFYKAVSSILMSLGKADSNSESSHYTLQSARKHGSSTFALEQSRQESQITSFSSGNRSSLGTENECENGGYSAEAKLVYTMSGSDQERKSQFSPDRILALESCPIPPLNLGRPLADSCRELLHPKGGKSAAKGKKLQRYGTWEAQDESSFAKSLELLALARIKQ